MWVREYKWSMPNKLLIYKTVLRPVWTYGIELWGCTATSNIDIIQRYQSKMLRSITNAPWYVTNQTLTSGSAHPTRSNGIPGTNSRTPRHLASSHKPAHGNTTKVVKQQTPYTEVDFWWNKLRTSQGTPPSSTSPIIITLAHRKRCIKFSDC